MVDEAPDRATHVGLATVGRCLSTIPDVQGKADASCRHRCGRREAECDAALREGPDQRMLAQGWRAKIRTVCAAEIAGMLVHTQRTAAHRWGMSSSLWVTGEAIR